MGRLRTRVRSGEPNKMTAYEQAAAAFIFFNFVLSVAATLFAVSVGAGWCGRALVRKRRQLSSSMPHSVAHANAALVLHTRGGCGRHATGGQLSAPRGCAPPARLGSLAAAPSCLPVWAHTSSQGPRAHAANPPMAWPGLQVKAIDEIKQKQRDEYNRFTVLSDTLQYEPDNA